MIATVLVWAGLAATLQGELEALKATNVEQHKEVELLEEEKYAMTADIEVRPTELAPSPAVPWPDIPTAPLAGHPHRSPWPERGEANGRARFARGCEGPAALFTRPLLGGCPWVNLTYTALT